MARPRKPLPDAAPLDDPEYAERLELAKRLRAEMSARGLTEEAIGTAAGVEPAYVYAITGAQKGPSFTVLGKIAAALDLTIAGLYRGVRYPQSRQATTQIAIRGGARHGAWKSMALDESPRGMAADVVPLDKRYASFPRISIEIEDDSLMGYVPPIPRGYAAVVADFTGTEVEVESGRVYLINRSGPGGLFETAFWRVSVFRDRYELTPLWADAARNEASRVTLPREEFERGEVIAVGGILLGSTMQVL
jgi:transcriptional regulator with XRE-family HTH domain